jgi:hypothetical protein
MDTLCITDVVLHSSPEILEISDLAFTESLAFEDMHDSQIMEEIIHLLCGPYRISFACCTFGGIADTFKHFGNAGVGGELVLAEINQDMALLLRVWDAYYLNIRQCPSFDDVTLEVMGSEENGTFACATYMRALTVYNCSNFSIVAL